MKYLKQTHLSWIQDYNSSSSIYNSGIKDISRRLEKGDYVSQW